MQEYSLIESGDVIVTKGVDFLIGHEFSVKKGSYTNDGVKLVLDYIIKYVESEQKVLKDKETFGCGSWMLQFVFNGSHIELHELKDTRNNRNVYEFDLTHTIQFTTEQMHLCSTLNVSPDIPKIGQKVALSPEIYGGAEVNAVRYALDEHMTGWFMTSNSYDGNIKSLHVDHLFHLLMNRPDLAKFTALPIGYRFYKSKHAEDVWFDQEVLKS